MLDQYAATETERLLQMVHEDPVPGNQRDFWNDLAAHPKYRSVLDEDGLPGWLGGRLHPVHSSLTWARKCKAGLSWATKSAICVHFILDRINMITVTEKRYPADSTNKSITGSELRWIYRNRHNPHVQYAIQFWEHGVPVPPLWKGKGAAIWNRYHPTHGPVEVAHNRLRRLFAWCGSCAI